MTEPIELNETQRATLRAVCDTVVPPVEGRDEFCSKGLGDLALDRIRVETVMMNDIAGGQIARRGHTGFAALCNVSGRF